MNTDFFTMRELVSRAFARYLRVIHSGFQLSSDNIVPSISANIIASARRVLSIKIANRSAEVWMASTRSLQIKTAPPVYLARPALPRSVWR